MMIFGFVFFLSANELNMFSANISLKDANTFHQLHLARDGNSNKFKIQISIKMFTGRLSAEVSEVLANTAFYLKKCIVNEIFNQACDPRTFSYTHTGRTRLDSSED